MVKSKHRNVKNTNFSKYLWIQPKQKTKNELCVRETECFLQHVMLVGNIAFDSICYEVHCVKDIPCFAGSKCIQMVKIIPLIMKADKYCK